MRLWSVRVKCISGTKEKPRASFMTALVEAKTSCEALEIGESVVEDRVSSDVTWLEFKAMQAAAVHLPILANDL